MKDVQCAACGLVFTTRYQRVRYCDARKCQQERARTWRKADPERERANQRRSQAKREERMRTDPEYRAHILARNNAAYQRRREAGISKHNVAPVEVFTKLLTKQGGVCAICRRPETAKDPSGRIKRLAVDHNAETGRVRGLLCARCNTAIGLFGHHAGRVMSAVDYLMDHNVDARAAIAVLDRVAKENG